MGRPKKATGQGRKAQVKKDDAKAIAEFEDTEDFEQQLRIVNRVCNAVDQEVESRSAAVVAIGDGHMASASTQMQLLISRVPEYIRKMPMKKFLKEHCPNTKANTRPDETLYFDFVQDSTGLNFNTDSASVQNTPGFGPSQTMKEYIDEGVRNQLAGEVIEQLSWDEFLAAYRMQSAMKGPSAWDTPSLRTPGMKWRDTQNYTPLIEKVFPSSHTGNTLVGGTKRKAPTSCELWM